MTKASREQAALRTFAEAGLTVVGPLVKSTEEQECCCQKCGTKRLVRLSNLRKGGVACRWCHGWAKWTAWGEGERQRAMTHRPIRGADWVGEALRDMRLIPLTPLGDEFAPVGVVCMECGEMTAVMPERFVPERGWNGCERCSQHRKTLVRESAGEVFRKAGLRLVGDCHGEFAPQLVECLTCGALRRVSYAAANAGTAPACWVCTTGINANEPHRVYLVKFPDLGVLKVGLTHNRGDRRLTDHELGGGHILETVVVANRAAARTLERAILQEYEPWHATAVGPSDFPQGGYTETWLDVSEAPPCSLNRHLERMERVSAP